MCFDADSQPPIAPIAGAAVDGSPLTLAALDGNEFSAYHAVPATPGTARMLVLPDVRGLFHYYEELALRFAEAGIEALAIDYFGRTAGIGRRDADFDFMPHVGQTTWAGLSADIRAAVARLRGDDPDARVFVVGFCFGGRIAFDSGSLGLGLAGAIGCYGVPIGQRGDIPAPVDIAAELASPILGLFGGADGAIPETSIAAFEDALTSAGVTHELVTYPDAPHSFFDRKADQFADASADSWRRILDFVALHSVA
ncbi:MAG: dienelactone hydrolase family protein [Chloroflexi bacterium]|nr:dienelactone hydrolase family protein [Chloroflexota bacterium]